MRERALHFGETGNLVGVVTQPDPDARGDVEGDLPGVILLDAGILHRIGPSRMNVRLARRLTAEGFVCLRFDFSGIGDSEPRPDALPFEVSSVKEIREAMDVLHRTWDVDDFVLFGLCSGADAALHGALADGRVVGLVSIDGHAYRTWRFYLHHCLSRLFQAESWKNFLTGRSQVGPWIRGLLNRNRENEFGPGAERDGGGDVFRRPRLPRAEMEEALRALADRDVRMLQVFSGGMIEHYNYASQYRDSFPSVEFGDLLRVEYFGDADHTFTDLDHLDALIATVGGWARETWPAAKTAGSAGTGTAERDAAAGPRTPRVGLRAHSTP